MTEANEASTDQVSAEVEALKRIPVIADAERYARTMSRAALIASWLEAERLGSNSAAALVIAELNRRNLTTTASLTQAANDEF